MVKTTVFEKFVTSFFNVLIVGMVFIPFYFIVEMSVFQAKIVVSSFFLLSNIIPLTFKEKRDWGMVIMRTYWKKRYNFGQHLVYSILYTLSFSTILFWVFFPFDLLLFNFLILQLPSILLTGTTFHGLLSGRMETVKK